MHVTTPHSACACADTALLRRPAACLCARAPQPSRRRAPPHPKPRRSVTQRVLLCTCCRCSHTAAPCLAGLGTCCGCRYSALPLTPAARPHVARATCGVFAFSGALCKCAPNSARIGSIIWLSLSRLVCLALLPVFDLSALPAALPGQDTRLFFLSFPFFLFLSCSLSALSCRLSSTVRAAEQSMDAMRSFARKVLVRFQQSAFSTPSVSLLLSALSCFACVYLALLCSVVFPFFTLPVFRLAAVPDLDLPSPHPHTHGIAPKLVTSASHGPGRLSFLPAWWLVHADVCCCQAC